MNSNSELIIGIVRPVGVDADPVISCMKDCLARFNYQIKTIKVSSEILSQFSNRDDFSNEYDRANHFMDLGDNIRKASGDGSILMKGVSAYIYKELRHEEPRPLGRVVYIIDSIKHPDEVEFLRDTYADGFHLIGILSSVESRVDRLVRRKSLSAELAEELLARDEDETESHGQHTREVFQDSDYFIAADGNQDLMEASVYRLFDLIFGNAFITPTFGEFAMFAAYVASLRSADLSRQVGAVVTRRKEVLAQGTNDCPTPHGGLYWQRYDDEQKAFVDEKGGRDYTLGYDTNKIQQNHMAESILNSLGLDITDDNIKAVKSAGLGMLTEYGRVVHAEMEAILMCARNGLSVRGCDMYVTTFPCHNCAKHIIAAGINKVVYIEPYPKSKTFDFYKNEITEKAIGEDAATNKIRFIPFYGVGPHRFMDLFAMKSTRWQPRKRKGKSGTILEWNERKANVRNPMQLLNYLDSERAAYITYTNAIDEVRAKGA